MLRRLLNVSALLPNGGKGNGRRKKKPAPEQPTVVVKAPAAPARAATNGANLLINSPSVGSAKFHENRLAKAQLQLDKWEKNPRYKDRPTAGKNIETYGFLVRKHNALLMIAKGEI